jgi:hypothetical protein
MGHGNGGFGGLIGLSTIGEERVQVKRWEGSGSRGELWDGGGKGKKVCLLLAVTIHVMLIGYRMWNFGFRMVIRWFI